MKKFTSTLCALSLSTTLLAPTLMTSAPADAYENPPCMISAGLGGLYPTTDCTNERFLAYSSQSLLKQFFLTIPSYALKGAAFGAALFVIYQLLYEVNFIKRPAVPLNGPGN
ncbi:MAG: hypothetical protein Q3962_04850 [Corynebacterium sp.]|nr:hypothetical protein [Corynebacterium sp.]